MRLTKEAVEAREKFLFDLFLTDPGMSGAKAQAKVKEQFGHAMRPTRLYEIRASAAKQILDQKSSMTIAVAANTDVEIVATQTPTTDTKTLTETDVQEAFGTPQPTEVVPMTRPLD